MAALEAAPAPRYDRAQLRAATLAAVGELRRHIEAGRTKPRAPALSCFSDLRARHQRTSAILAEVRGDAMTGAEDEIATVLALVDALSLVRMCTDCAPEDVRRCSDAATTVAEVERRALALR